MPDLAARLAAFRQAHPPREVAALGQRWRLLEVGSGDTLVILPGGLRLAEPAFAIMEALGATHRVVVPDYPAVGSIEALADGLAAAVPAPRFTLMGSSLGGMLAQVFAQRHPRRVERLILASTFPPTPARAAAMRGSRRQLRWAPGFLVRRVMTRTYQSFTTPSPEDKRFWDAYMAEAVAHRLTRADFLATVDNVIGFHERFQPGPLAMPVLILDSDNDPVVTPAEREALLALYPGADHDRLHGAGHTMFLSAPDAAVAVLAARLNAPQKGI